MNKSLLERALSEKNLYSKSITENKIINSRTANASASTSTLFTLRKRQNSQSNLKVTTKLSSSPKLTDFNCNEFLLKQDGEKFSSHLHQKLGLQNKDIHCSISNMVGQKKLIKIVTNYLIEILIRILLFIVFIQLERLPPFKRKIHPEELWLYKNPRTDDYISAALLIPSSFFVPFLIICLNFVIKHDKYDFIKSVNAITLAIPLNGVLTSVLKVSVGRLRPDFYYRCFPNGIEMPNMNCTGIEAVINEGRKSFPSGHSSFAFAGFGFLFLYLAAKLNCFNEKGRGQSWRLCLSLIPLLFALLVAVSRTCDYHHHWQDALVGSIIGMVIAIICYRQYYPSIFDVNCDRPYYYNKNNNRHRNSSIHKNGKNYVAIPNTSEGLTNKNIDEDVSSLIDDEESENTKWI